MGRPRKYANDRDKWRANKRAQRRPTQRHVLAPQTPGRYEMDLGALLAAGQRFGTIYADPPWPYDNQATRGSTDKHYVTMPVAEICTLPVAALAAPACHLHMWVTKAFFFEAPTVLEAWGFRFVNWLTWCKPHLGMGNTYRNATELLVLGVRGNLPVQARNVRDWIEARSDCHSAKPERVRDLVEQLSPGPYLELFGRAAVPGWTVWGNECLSTTGRLFKDRTW